MASRGGGGGFTPMGLSPMNVVHAAGMRMPGMPQPPGGYSRGMNNAPQCPQRPGMPSNRVGGPMGSMGGQLPGPSYGSGNMSMRQGMGSSRHGRFQKTLSSYASTTTAAAAAARGAGRPETRVNCGEVRVFV
ncbi:hypothetical protein CesoFtcFv8_022052 [Champsocephalus esox]|uniref:Uncharacterized protein n=1 Tax=Champsocephalus esox TaxID=159716 RepID=A0AAN8BA14_9TELE|nr:hypothetical protein CesoFtcFv8_022052 [Champsocephalus esox]